MSTNSTHFDITATPTLQAVATADERLLVSDLQKRLDEAILQAHNQDDVAEAMEAHRSAEAVVEKLQTASRVLNDQARHLRDQISVAADKTLDKLISSAGSGKLDFAQAANLASLEHRERLISRALERVVEHLTPLAQVARARAESHALMAHARAIEAAAQQRAEKVLGQLRDAVSDEVVLPIDMSKGVAGALLTHAAGLKRRAMETSGHADQIENSYMQRTGRTKTL